MPERRASDGHLNMNETKLPSVIQYYKTSKIWSHSSEPCVCLTGVQGAFARPFQGADVLQAGHPHGQVVLILRRDPSRTQYCPDIQAEGEENAHQSDQLQRRQRGYPDLLCAAYRRSHVRSNLIQTKTKKKGDLSGVTMAARSQLEVAPAISCRDGELRVTPRPECGERSPAPPRWKQRSAARTEPRIALVREPWPCWVLVPGQDPVWSRCGALSSYY